jgi:transglutaminase-like putative cysteine protease
MNAHRLLAAGMIAFQTWLLFLVGERIVPVLVLVGLAWGVFGTPPELLRARKWPARVALGFGMALLYWFRVGQAEPSQLPQLTWSLPVAGWLISVQTLELLGHAPCHRLPGLAAALPVLALFILFGSRATPVSSATALSWSVVGVSIWAFIQQSSVLDESTREKSGANRWLLSCMLLSAVALLAWQFEAAIATQALRLQTAVMGQLARRVSTGGLARTYNWNTTLSGVTAQKQLDPSGIALTVYCQVPPGYLRSAAYDVLAGTRWTSSGGRDMRLTPIEPAQSLPPPSPTAQVPKGRELVFAIDEAARGPLTRLDIRNEKGRGVAFFAPLKVAYAQGAGGDLVLSEHGIVKQGLDTTQIYTVWVAPESRQAPPPQETTDRLLEVPSTLGPALGPLIAHLPGGQQSVEQKVAAVEDYFRRYFRYSLQGFETPRAENPLAYFLRARPAAHCEFFASAAVMLLRQQGIPARYVMGYVVTELEEEDGDFWLARNRNAHAWAEAYDSRRQQWLIVEATPGVHVPKTLGGSGSQFTAANNNSADRPFSQSKQSTLEAFWIWLTPENFSEILWRLVAAVLAVGTVWMTARWLWMARPRTYAARRHALLRRLDRQIARKSLRRRSGETLHQFAERLRARTPPDPWLVRAADWYIDYANSIYSGEKSSQLPLPLPVYRI